MTEQTSRGRIKVHYHSDCSFFAGCESMLANFFNSEKFANEHDVTFSYRNSERYRNGFEQRVWRSVKVIPLNFPDLSEFPRLTAGFPARTGRLLSAFTRLLLTGPALIFEVFVLYGLLRKLRPDIVHINNGGYPGALSARAAAIAGRLAGVPKVIMVVNNMAVGYHSLTRYLDYPLDRMVGWSVDVFVTGSQAAAVRLGTSLNFIRSSIKAIHNGIAMRDGTTSAQITRERLGLADFGGVVFGVVALLEPRKGHKVLFDALLKRVSEGLIGESGLKILIEGDGPLMGELVEFISKHKLDTWVKFVGHEKNIVDFMSALDVLILPSVRDEDFPNVILEAMALGKPVIASRLAGTPEQVEDGVTGILVQPRSIEQLGDAVFYLANNRKVISSMGQAGLDRFNRYFTSDKALQNYSKLYSKFFEIQND
jgi:glycosyltransferase involved in cell wall biosynthesis